MKNDFFNTAQTYTQDLQLFKELGLKPFKVNCREKKYVGDYVLPDYDIGKIKIFVECYPAQFWSFEVETCEGEKLEISTGSGTLSEYWESVIHVATGCFVVTKLN